MGVSPTIQRAWYSLHIKAVDVEHRLITGIATTPEPDRLGDVIEPKGVKFRNPLPLLLFHDHTRPVGIVKFDKATDDGITFEASIPDITEPGTLKDRVDEAWQSVRAKLVRGVSIGFRVLDDGIELLRTGGVRFTKTEVLELSLVTVPANQSATILSIKSIDADHLAASGTGVASHPAGVTASSRVVSITRKDSSRPMAKTITEQISAFEATRQAKAARMTELMTTSGDKGETLDESQAQEYDGLETEIKTIDAHLVRLAALETANKHAAQAVNGSSAVAASASRGGVITVKDTLPKGTAFTRYVMAMAAGRGSRLEAYEYAKRWESSTPEVGLMLKAAMTAGTTTDSDWAAPLVVAQNMVSEFVELLRPATIIGRIPGLRRVPFNISMPTQTQGSTVGWVGQGKPKPVSELKFGATTLGMAKAAGIVVLSEELVRSSAPSAEAIVRADLIATMAQFLDRQFVDPAVAAVANVSPASITNGITPVEATGVTAATFNTDVRTLLATFTAANLSLSGAVWIMTETQAQALSMMLTTLGNRVHPDITMVGGTLFGIPVVASQNLPSEGGSPGGAMIILVKANEILLADDGGVNIDVSREASLQMDSAPDDPQSASTVMVSLWQNNLVGLRAERFINWKRRRDEAVGYIEGATYIG